MPDVKKYIPEITKLKQYDYLNELWNEVYKKRKKKSGKEKAVYSANAAVYSEALKIFLGERSNIKKLWKTKSIETEMNEKVKDYHTYDVDGHKVIITTEPHVLKDFPFAERKGQFKNMDDEFDREILSKLIDDYDVKIHPEMYYVINGEK